MSGAVKWWVIAACAAFLALFVGLLGSSTETFFIAVVLAIAAVAAALDGLRRYRMDSARRP